MHTKLFGFYFVCLLNFHRTYFDDIPSLLQSPLIPPPNFILSYNINKQNKTNQQKQYTRKHGFCFMLANYSWTWSLRMNVVVITSVSLPKKIEFCSPSSYQLQIAGFSGKHEYWRWDFGPWIWIASTLLTELAIINLSLLVSHTFNEPLPNLHFNVYLLMFICHI